MSLSRLTQFLQSARGKILHVNPEDLNSTDSIANQGTSPLTPFKTLNRALLEASRYSYQIGNSNDLFNFCTIKLYSGEHYVDNRPGTIIDDTGVGYLRSGSSSIINEFTLNTNLEITDPDNKLYILNSVNGGLIIPRGTSIIAEDLRKTIIRPLYVPDPQDNNIERSAIFRITGASFFYGFSILDANPGGFCYKNYSSTKNTPNFSHHKLTVFEYVDGINVVSIDDDFLTLSTTRTDLQQYYEKISLVYGSSSGREIEDVDYIGGVSVDIQPIIDEFRIVGPRGDQIGISTIISGNGITPTETITVTLDSSVEGIAVDTSIQVSGVNYPGYDGQFVVKEIPSENQIKYITPTIPTVASPSLFGATVNIISDTVKSSSPYIYNVSLKSVYGLCGLHADGSKVDGFKSVVIAQFTAVSLQKDNNAFVIYDETSGSYLDSTSVSDLYKNTKAIYKPSFSNYHIKVSNDAFAQLVSVFSIGYATQIVAESGGDYSITNSNSNFGAKTFLADGYKNDAFDQDNHGYIIGFIPPQEITKDPVNVSFSPIDIGLTKTVSSGGITTTRLYLYDETNEDVLPESYIDGYKIGSKLEDTLNITSPEEASSVIVMPNTDASGEKSFLVQRINGNTENSISAGVINLTLPHTFEAGEKIRVISQTGQLPDKIEDKIYFVINTSIDGGLSSSQIKLATTYSNAINNISISPNKKGGKLSIVSKVSDKIPNEPGHPIQWDDTNKNWYINVSSTNNGIYTAIKDLSIETTGRSYVIRTLDKRINENKIYKLLYSIPNKTTTSARPPVNGFIIQETNNSSLSGTEFNRYFGSTSLLSDNELRNPKFISTVSWSSNEVTVTTELPHNLNVNSVVEVVNVTPSGYNGTFTVTKVPTSRTFVYSLSTNPGSFSNDTRERNNLLPYIKRKDYKTIFKIYKSTELQPYIQNVQDGVYELTVINASNSPNISPFNGYKFSQPIENLYPQLNRDNVNSDPDPTASFAESKLIGNVVVDDPQKSITKETLYKINQDFNVGFGITAIISNATGTAHTIYTNTDHNLSQITQFTVVSSGTSYVTGTYYGVGVSTTNQGTSAAFKVDVNAGGLVSAIELMYGGSGYSVGDRLSIVSGIQTSPGFVAAVIGITSVSYDVNNIITLGGFTGDYSPYNNCFTITSVPKPKELTISSTASLSGYSTSLVSVDASATFNGKAISVSSLSYNNVSGVGTVTFATQHGLPLNSKVRFVGFTSTFYNQDVLISSVNSSTEIEVDFGPNIIIPPTTGSNRLGIPLSISSTNEKNRTKYYYDSIVSNLGGALSANSPDGTAVVVNNANTLGFKKGDYVEINGEILRIKSAVTSTSVVFYRAKFGTDRKTHPINSVVRKINIVPVELRRNSIIRASGHTFEYVGYGPGNYSTSLPENQDRELSVKEKNNAISTKLSGGTVYYSGMDENGDFYSGTKKISSITGSQVSYDIPIPLLYGETLKDVNIVEKGIFTDSIQVNGNSLSEFSGPVIFDDKVSSTSDKGLEVKSLFIQGNKYTVGDSEPIPAGNPGDVQYNINPSSSGFLGWVYTSDNEWKEFGKIGGPEDVFGVGIGTTSYVGFSTLINFNGNNISIIPEYDSILGITTLTFVGIGSTDIFGNNKVGSISGERWNSIPIVNNIGSMEIGRYIDFHNSNVDVSDYTYRLDNNLSGILTTSGSLGVGGDLRIDRELYFTGIRDTYINFNVNSGNIAYFRFYNVGTLSFSNAITITEGGSVSLFHNNSTKLSTSSDGIIVNGGIETVDGDSIFDGNIEAINGTFSGVVSGRTRFSVYNDDVISTNIILTTNDMNKVVLLNTSNPRTISLPIGSSIQIGDWIRIVDVGSSSTNSGNACKNNITITPNTTDRIQGGSTGDTLIMDVDSQALTLMWCGSSYNWRIVN